MVSVPSSQKVCRTLWQDAVGNQGERPQTPARGIEDGVGNRRSDRDEWGFPCTCRGEIGTIDELVKVGLTGQHRAVVDQHRAGFTLALTTTRFGARQPQRSVKEIEQAQGGPVRSSPLTMTVVAGHLLQTRP